MFSPLTGQTRPILPGLHKSKQEDSKGERQEERVREAHREESGDFWGILGVSWGHLGGILGASWRHLGGIGGDVGVLEVGWVGGTGHQKSAEPLPLQKT